MKQTRTVARLPHHSTLVGKKISARTVPQPFPLALFFIGVFASFLFVMGAMFGQMFAVAFVAAQFATGGTGRGGGGGRGGRGGTGGTGGSGDRGGVYGGCRTGKPLHGHGANATGQTVHGRRSTGRVGVSVFTTGAVAKQGSFGGDGGGRFVQWFVGGF